MIKDFKNVIITFGLIAAALTSGSFLYRKKVESEYAIAVKQEQLQNLIDEQQAVLDSLNQHLGASSVALEQSNVIQPQTPASTTTKNVVKPKQSVPAATIKPIASQAPPKPVSQTSPVVQAPTPTPPKAPVVIKPTRKSRAS